MLEQEFKFYLDNQKDLVKKYNGRVLVIRGNKVVADFDTEADAFLDSAAKYPAGTFLIQVCKPDLDVQTFHSRAIF